MGTSKKVRKKTEIVRKATPQKDSSMPSKLLLTIGEVVEMTGMSYGTLWKKWSTGKMPKPLKIGHRTKRFRYSDIKAWVDNGCKSMRSA